MSTQALSWELEGRLKAGLAKYRIPGASLALFADDRLHEAAAGFLNLDTAVEATPESLFHVASITKPMTTTLAMQLVDEGKLNLDAPVQRYLPAFRVASSPASAAITVRQLMCHASGIDGDLFIETTRGEDRVAKLVEAGRDLPQLHEPGQGFSYCNHAFAVLGRILEVLEGSDFDTIWRARLSEKLATPSLLTLPREALRYRVAVGHMGGANGFRVVPQLFLGTSNGPAGSTPMARARDLVSFALMHLNEGMTREGQRMLSAGAVRAMREAQNTLPPGQVARQFGLGWMLFDWNDHKLFGHDGHSIFQRSYLRILPEKRMVFALLTNGGDGGGVFREIANSVFGTAGVTMTPIREKQGVASKDAHRYVGDYARRSTDHSVTADPEGRLSLSMVWNDKWARDLYGVQGPFPLEPAGDEIFLWRVPGLAEPGIVNFLHPDRDGRFRSLHVGLRINHRQ